MNKTSLMKLTALLLLCVFALTPLGVHTQERAEPDINAQIAKEEAANSQIMHTLHFFTDVYGPRLTGSPSLKAAGEWAVKQMQTWGFENAHLEPWAFGHPGWVNERATGFITAPVKDTLVFEVLSWTPSTNGAVTAEAYQLILPEHPTREELTVYLDGVKAKVAGKIVLAGKQAVIPVNITPPPKRLSDEDLRPRFDPVATPTPTPTPSPTPTPNPAQLTARQIDEQLDQFLRASGALVRVNDAGREHGQIRAFNNRTFDVDKVVPTVVLRNEDYGRIARLLADGTAVTLEFNIQNRSFPEGTTAYNVVAEIPGTDKRDEVIMLGGHLDSWHAATGATDNAIGCATMMEAARILKAIGVQPAPHHTRRTVER
jgi:carboxypeptidase Q